ncbi:MAG: ABC transporter ATP-binding protein [Ruminococcus sp.]|nr:ABC transporter ATP-binding protein [Ruminococcus sp.]
MQEFVKTIVELKNVSKEFGSNGNIQKAVDNVSFTVNKGEFVVLLGQSGAGKSTVLNMIGGLDFATSGNIIVDGTDISKMSEKDITLYRADKVGFIFQFYNLIPSLTALENVSLIKSIVKDCDNPSKMLELVGLGKHEKKFPSQLSGGEQQRVSIARALCKKPDIILGDEPTGALDSETGMAVIALLQKLCREEKKTVIIVTHNVDYSAYADKIIKMCDGKIVECIENNNVKNID